MNYIVILMYRRVNRRVVELRKFRQILSAAVANGARAKGATKALGPNPRGRLGGNRNPISNLARSPKAGDFSHLVGKRLSSRPST